MRYRGKVWRHVPFGAQPLHVGFILKANGRWNRPGEYGCLYTALTRRGARAELMKYRERVGASGLSLSTRDLVSIRVNLNPVMDLTDPANSPVLPRSGFLIGDSDEDWEACRTLADTLRAQGFAGILAPSAAIKGEKNLMIYIDGPARDIRLDDGGERVSV